MCFSQLNIVFLLFGLFNSFTVILLLPNSIDISIVIHYITLLLSNFILLTQFLLLCIQFYGYQISCKICNKAVANNHHAIQCDKFCSWIHIKCNKINLSSDQYLQHCVYAWYCIKCFENIIPFSNI